MPAVAVHDSFRVNDVYGGHGGKGGHGMRFLIDNRMNEFSNKGAGIWGGAGKKLAGYSGFGNSFGIGGLSASGYGNGGYGGYGAVNQGHGYGHGNQGYGGRGYGSNTGYGYGSGHGQGYGQAFGSYNLW